MNFGDLLTFIIRFLFVGLTKIPLQLLDCDKTWLIHSCFPADRLTLPTAPFYFTLTIYSDVISQSFQPALCCSHKKIYKYPNEKLHSSLHTLNLSLSLSRSRLLDPSVEHGEQNVHPGVHRPPQKVRGVDPRRGVPPHQVLHRQRRGRRARQGLRMT